ncbi:ZIP family metal transporter [Pseudomonas sp. P1B16]|jgi:ZIP family zinc transporter|uniref:ZIP family metal transporter n=2 Tax=Pseudomonas capeferrum TaxID=1495066 RepID=A0ABY7RE25_9PSED|nr:MULTISPECIES: ZIP family metal transporter [Pseudomonas]KEY86824.1 membrane protein [Pseudomonas capeferrum]KGI90996.1 membrane protein [Pseudomonas sp. H2]MBC3482421.1 ZIP family metal transporter [Pseudomonas sp. SWRI77]MBC3500347.1 ZIP family metal transporter [Pseudomonas sp. SWRI59]MBC3505676.1 ZIP family metal transporter [Pseudomonas sp. SWRI68]
MPPAHTETATSPSLLSAWRQQVVNTPWLSAGLGLSLLAVVVLLAASLWNAVSGDHADNLHLALLGGLSGFAATALGAVLAVVLRDVSARTQDVMLGFAAGMMLAASSFSLILPGLDAAREITGNGPAAAFTVVLGMGLGVLLMLGLDRFTPHEHESTGRCGPEAERINRVWLFVLAITLHNLPEGMAIGVSFANGDMNIGLPLTSAIAIQDIPEGLAVALALRATGLSNMKAALVAIGSGLMEPLGAVIGLGISTGFALAYPISMGLAAGAMIFVVSHEVIPETHRNGHQTAATLGLMGGFGVMMFLDTALG